MNITLDVLNLSTESFEVNQFDHNTAVVTAAFPIPFRGIDISSLSPFILVSTGDTVVEGDELVVGSSESTVGLVWTVSQRYTQRPGTFFVQFAFADNLGTVKVYSDRCVMRVKPSVDYARDFFSYNPSFIDRMWHEIEYKINSSIPLNVSAFNNDAGYISGDFDLRDYVTKQEMNVAVSQVSGKKKWKLINSFTVPDTPTGEIGYVTFAPDAYANYTHGIYVDRDSDGNAFSLSDVAVYMKQESSLTRYSMNFFLYANAPSVSTGGTKLFNKSAFITTGSSEKNEIEISRYCDRWHIEAICQDENNTADPNYYAKLSTENIGDRNISSLRMVIETAGSSVLSMTGGIEVEVWGVEA